jgi:hypothetical protein
MNTKSRKAFENRFNVYGWFVKDSTREIAWKVWQAAVRWQKRQKK